MNAVEQWWGDIRDLTLQSVRVWWRVLPRLLTWAILGWLGYQLSLQIAGRLAAHWPWLAMGVFALGFVATLAAAVVSLRIVGDELGVPALVAQQAADQDRDEPEGEAASMTRVLALTLLPFLGIYAAFGYTDDRAAAMLALDYGRTAGLSEDIMLRLDPLASTRATITVLAIVVGAYIVRRVLDLVHDRVGWRVLGFAVAAFEAFFLLVAIFAGQRLFRFLVNWLESRQLVTWILDDLAPLAQIARELRLPQVWSFFVEHVWSPLADVLVEPVVWLALAALVLGSRFASIADLWRQGHTGHQNRLARIRNNHGLRRVALETQEALLGDIDDKYLPTWWSLRLIVRAGLAFLASYVVVYAVVAAAKTGLISLIRFLVGGHDFAFWASFDPVIGLVDAVAVEPLRLVLLAVAYRRCLQRLDARPGDTSAATPVRRGAYLAGVAAVTVLSLTFAGVLRAGLERIPDYQSLRTTVGVPVTMADGAIVTVTRVEAGTMMGSIPTSGVYIQVVGTLGAPTPNIEKFHAARLMSGENEFRSLPSGSTRPGYESDFSAIFEVGPALLAGSRFEYWAPGKITQYHQRVVVDLGIDETRARALIAQAQGKALPDAPYGERPLS